MRRTQELPRTLGLHLARVSAPLAADEELQRFASLSDAALEDCLRSIMRTRIENRGETPHLEKLRRILAQTLAMASLLGRRRVLLIAKAKSRGRSLAAAAERGQCACFAKDTVSPFVPAVRFEEAIDDILTRYPVLAPGYRAVQEAYAKGHAFALAKSTSMVLTKKVQKIMADSVSQGRGLAKTRDVIAQMGDWTRSYSENVYRTNATTAYAQGVRAQAEDPDVLEICPALTFVGRNVPPSRHNHIAAVGLIAGTKDPLWKKYTPPLGYQCLLEGQRVSGRFVGGSKTRYLGPAVEIHTRQGTRLAVTGNHPVLSSRGWVPAQEVREGDHLFRHLAWGEALVTGPRNGVSPVPRIAESSWAVDDQEIPPSVEQVFESLRSQGRVGEIPRRGADPLSLDFHGEARFFQSNVEVVGTYVSLPFGEDSKAFEFREELLLVKAESLGASRHRLRSPNAVLQSFLDSADGSVGGAAVLCDCGGLPVVSHRPRPFRALCFGPGARFLPVQPEPSPDGALVHADFVSDVVRALPCFVSRNESGDVEPIHLAASAFGIVHDRVLSVRRFTWDGSVYDFETTDGWMIAEGVCIANCGHSVNPVDKWELQERGLLSKAGKVRTYYPPGFEAAGPDPGFAK